MRTIPDHTRRSSGPLTHARGYGTPELRLIGSSPDLRRSYESLMSSLHLQNGTRPLKSLLLTSAQPEEGKTTVAIGLALALVRAGKRVLLVDADLRRPALHRVFGLENNKGLGEVLAGDIAGTASRYEIPIPDVGNGPPRSLYLITSGRSSARLLATIQSTVLLDTIRGFATEHDFVLVDSPPLLSVSDSMLLASAVDGVILILRTGLVREVDARCAMERLSRTGGRVLGVVMNRFDATLHGRELHPYRDYYE